MPMMWWLNLPNFWIASLAFALVPLAQAVDFESKPGAALVFVTQTGCHFCDRLDQQVISPFEASGLFTGTVQLARVSIDPGQQVTDHEGLSQAASTWASNYGAYGTPTLLLLRADGTLDAEPLYGVPDAIDFFGYKIEQAVAELAKQP